MTTCAVYARKSTDDTDRNEEARSTARQVAHATEYAQAHGWTVNPAHVYVDEGVSGAEWGPRRRGLNRLLAAVANGHPPFEVLIVSELSRLGRDTVRVPYTIQQIEDGGVAIHGYLSGQRITVDTEVGEMQTMLHSLAASYERRRAKQRSHDALLQRARAGHVANGVCFAYRNEPVLIGGRRAHSRRVIVPDEAVVVVRIFELCAAGAGYGKIAHVLNEQGAAAPSPRRPGRRHSWSTTTVRDALMREAYRGQITWNKRRREMRQGRCAVSRRVESEWVTRTDESLRIVSEALWTAAHERLASTRALYFARTNGVAHRDRAIPGTESPYLLAGFLTCGACGGTMFAHRNGPARFSYLCTHYHVRGRAVCKNGLGAAKDLADENVISAVERDLLNVPVLETALFKAMALVQPPRERDATKGLRADLIKLEASITRLAVAVAEGGDMRALVDEMRQRERRRTTLVAEVSALEREAASRRDPGVATHALDVMREAISDLRGTLRQDVPSARRTLRSLLAGRLVFTPQEREGERFYAFEGPGTVQTLITGALRSLPKALAAPR
jgi:site-specific DNA recombinase